MRRRSERGQLNRITVVAVLLQLSLGPAIGWCQPVEELAPGLISPAASIREGAALVLLFFAIGASMLVSAYVTGIRQPLCRQVSVTAFAAAVYSLASSGLGAFLLSADVRWSYLSLFFLWLILAGGSACLREVAADPWTVRILKCIAEGSKLLAAASLIGTAANITGFAWWIKLFAAMAAAGYLTSAIALIKALRLGKRRVEWVLLGLFVIPAFGLSPAMLAMTGFDSRPALPVLWGLLLLLMSFTGELKLPVQPLDHLSSIVREARLSADEIATAGKQPDEWPEKIAAFAHEINTPLSTGLLTATHLQDEVDDLYERFRSGALRKSDLEKSLLSYREASDMLVTNLETAAGLVRTLRSEAGNTAAVNRQRFNVKQHLAKILTALTPRIRDAGHQLHFSCPDNLTINADPVVFSQIISNLIINSLTHAYAPGMAGNLSIEVTPVPKGMKLIYRDDGKGIDKQALDKIFDPYFTTNAAAGNTGLGMFIVHSLVTKHLGGSIECSSTVGQGTAFTLHIPIEGS